MNENVEKKIVNTSINPDTGETQIFDTTEVEESTDKTFEERVDNKMKDSNVFEDITKPVTTEEFTETLLENDSFLKELSNGIDLNQEDIKGILTVTNKVIKKEEVNIYKELPETVRTMIDNYVMKEFRGIPTNRRGSIKKSVANSIIDNFIKSIQQERAKYDFAHELARLYKDGAKDLEDTALESHNERNKIYREVAEKIEDQDKKERMLQILDSIEEAKNLTKLKEFAKTCKIKSIELEKPHKVFNDFLRKYRDSSNNIYDIDIARKAIIRNINKEGTEYKIDAVNAFFISFCKQTRLYKESDPIEHAYMYYVLYYSVMTDAEDSKEFLNNIKEVIDNLLERNPRIKK